MSKTEVKEISPTVREIKVTIEPEKVREIYNKISLAFARSASIPGFRKGLAPLNLVKIHYKDEIKERVFGELVRSELVKAIEETGLHVISEEPQIFMENYRTSELNGTQEVSIKAVFEVMPEISKPEYEGLEIVRRIRPVTDEAIEKYIETRRKASAVFFPVEGRKSEIGDTVIADVRGWFLNDSDEEKALGAPDIEIEDVEILLGDEAAKREFSDNLIEAEEGEEREFVVQYDESYSQRELAGKSVKYRLKIKAVGKVELPELDDAWVQSLDEGYESLADFREKIRKNLEVLSKAESEERLKDEVVKELLKRNPIEVPLTLVHHQANFLLRDLLSELGEKGVDIRSIDEETLRKLHLSLMPRAKEQVRAALILDKIAEVEKIEVGMEDIQKEVDLVVSINNLGEEKREELLNNPRFRKSLEDNIKVRKTIQRIIEKANVIEGEWIEDAAVNSEKAEQTVLEGVSIGEADAKNPGTEELSAEKIEESKKPEEEKLAESDLEGGTNEKEGQSA